jgi:ABC-type sugar transport system substrate-binding protein
MQKRLRISLCLPDEKNVLQQMIKDDVLETAELSGLEAEVCFADNQILRQIEQIYNCIQDKSAPHTKAIIVVPVRDNKLDIVARDTVQAGVAWICVNRRMSCLEKLRQEFSHVPISFIGPDQYLIGQIQGRQIKALLPYGGRVMYVHGTAMTYSMRERLRGMQDITKDMNLQVDMLDGDWRDNIAEEVVIRWIRTRRNDRVKVDFICCQNDVMAVGVRRAIELLAKELGRPELLKIPITGVDGIPSYGLRLIDEGLLTATVVMPRTGQASVQHIARALKDSEPIPAEEILASYSYPSENALAERRVTE